jgi:Cu2+-exporting ATPase
VLENFALAAASNSVAVPLAALGLVTPLLAALSMAGSSLLMTLNALRILSTP